MIIDIVHSAGLPQVKINYSFKYLICTLSYRHTSNILQIDFYFPIQTQFLNVDSKQ